MTATPIAFRPAWATHSSGAAARPVALRGVGPQRELERRGEHDDADEPQGQPWRGADAASPRRASRRAARRRRTTPAAARDRARVDAGRVVGEHVGQAGAAEHGGVGREQPHGAADRIAGERPAPPARRRTAPATRRRSDEQRAEVRAGERPVARGEARAGRRIDVGQRRVEDERDDPGDGQRERPAGSGGRRRSGQPSQTSVSWSIATKAAPASGIVAGNVGACPGPGVGSKIPRTSSAPAIAWPSSGEHDRRDDDQHGVGPARPARAQPRARPVLPPERDHGDHRQPEGDERARARAATARRRRRRTRAARHRHDEQQTGQAERRLPRRRAGATARGGAEIGGARAGRRRVRAGPRVPVMRRRADPSPARRASAARGSAARWRGRPRWRSRRRRRPARSRRRP